MDQGPQDLTFDLHLVFAGMCLLVRDEVRKDKRTMLHILLPDGGQHMRHHEARLFVDTRYIIGSGAPKGMLEIQLEGGLIDLTNLVENGSADLSKMHDVVDLSCVISRPVPRALFNNANPGGRVKARISLAAGAAKQSNKGGRWNLGQCTGKHMATWLEWVIPNLPLGPFSLALAELNLSGLTGTLPLRPIGRKLELFVFHTKADDRPSPPLGVPLPNPSTRPASGSKAEHFTAFYPLANTSSDLEAPSYVGEEGETSREPNETSHIGHGDDADQPSGSISPSPRGIDFTCVAATARGAPES